jgi:hypothetical protein
MIWGLLLCYIVEYLKNLFEFFLEHFYHHFYGFFLNKRLVSIECLSNF